MTMIKTRKGRGVESTANRRRAQLFEAAKVPDGPMEPGLNSVRGSTPLGHTLRTLI
jgi:hypothetical protein